ncbi:hypothetical protein [Mesorhizobium sp.]|uniref:hypothetical protein n=1 Tax=Mesorhizobium sp. TaxID=1871066 RepID=UPI000FEA9E2F|nr:hypothetical protein [Mesorhizobium sp.]RWE95751.1 MAG: hypothetical protein EOS68_18855 [Mesorhizobium sp.]
MFAGSRLPREGRAMGKVEINIPLVTWRDGRPRFFASKVHRQLGYKGEDLRHGKSGPWFTVEEAIAWSDARQLELKQKRAAIAAGETTVKKVANAAERARLAGVVTISQLVEAFLDRNPRMKGVPIIDGKKRRMPLAAATVRGYKGSARLLEQLEDGAAWHEPADDMTPKVLTGILDKVEIKHGLAQARAMRAMISAAYGFGRSKAGGYLVRHNPVAGLENTLPVLEPRIRVGSIAEMVHFVACCDALGFPDIGDSIVLGLYTAQRQADRLALEDSKITSEGILFHQRKKGGQPLLIPMIEMLRDRVVAAGERRLDWRLNYPHVLIDERLRRPWDDHRYRKAFRVLRHAAAFGTLESVKGKVTPMAAQLLGALDVRAVLEAAGLKPMPSLNDFHDQDLRDTAVTWLALAQNDKWEIASITGHSLKSIDEILKHYFGLHPDLARSGMAKMEKWRRTAR